jgi:hypothetical protein
MAENNAPKRDTWNTALMAAYFFIPLYGLRIAAEKYFDNDRLPLTYFMLFGLAGALVAGLYMALLSKKSWTVKLVGLAVVLLVLVAINLMV